LLNFSSLYTPENHICKQQNKYILPTRTHSEYLSHLSCRTLIRHLDCMCIFGFRISKTRPE
jgi:hypothetical protein